MALIFIKQKEMLLIKKAGEPALFCYPLTVSTTALKASGLFMAKSANVLRLSFISDLLSFPINAE
jgi:hypothetical protein